MSDPDSVPVLWRLARLDHDRVRNRPVLLYPEGVVFLNETGHAILALCDGHRSIAAITATLAARYEMGAAEVAADVTEYLTELARLELLDVR